MKHEEKTRELTLPEIIDQMDQEHAISLKAGTAVLIGQSARRFWPAIREALVRLIAMETPQVSSVVESEPVISVVTPVSGRSAHREESYKRWALCEDGQPVSVAHSQAEVDWFIAGKSMVDFVEQHPAAMATDIGQVVWLVESVDKNYQRCWYASVRFAPGKWTSNVAEADRFHLKLDAYAEADSCSVKVLRNCYAVQYRFGTPPPAQVMLVERPPLTTQVAEAVELLDEQAKAQRDLKAALRELAKYIEVSDRGRVAIVTSSNMSSSFVARGVASIDITPATAAVLESIKAS